MTKSTDEKFAPKRIGMFLDIDQTLLDSEYASEEGEFFFNGADKRNDASFWEKALSAIKAEHVKEGYEIIFFVLTQKKGNCSDATCDAVMKHLHTLLPIRDINGEEIKELASSEKYYWNQYLKDEKDTENFISTIYLAKTPCTEKSSEILPALHVASPSLGVRGKAKVMKSVSEKLKLTTAVLVDNNPGYERSVMQEGFLFVDARELEQLAGGEKNLEKRNAAVKEVVKILAGKVSEYIQGVLVKKLEKETNKLLTSKHFICFGKDEQKTIKNTLLTTISAEIKRLEVEISKKTDHVSWFSSSYSPKRAHTYLTQLKQAIKEKTTDLPSSPPDAYTKKLYGWANKLRNAEAATKQNPSYMTRILELDYY